MSDGKGNSAIDFALTEDHVRIQTLCRALAADFATRAAQHDRDASSPVENYTALRKAGLFGLTIPKQFGGWGAGLLGYTIAAEEIAQGCASTALAFNMHAAMVATLTITAPLPDATKQQVADLVIKEGKLICALLSEPGSTGLLPTSYACATQARRVAGGYVLSGKKAFCTMVEASDYICLYAHPEEDANPEAGVAVLLPANTPGLHIERVWDWGYVRHAATTSCWKTASSQKRQCWATQSRALASGWRTMSRFSTFPIPPCTLGSDLPLCTRL